MTNIGRIVSVFPVFPVFPHLANLPHGMGVGGWGVMGRGVLARSRVLPGAPLSILLATKVCRGTG